MNKQIMSIALSAALVLGTVGAADSSFAAASSLFSDVGDSFAKDAIQELADKGIINGVDATHFDPKGELTREQLVTMMVKASGLKVDTSKLVSDHFKDVKGWAAPYIDAAFDAGIIEDADSGNFGPKEVLTRETAVGIIVLFLKTQGELDAAGVKLDFQDADQISEGAIENAALAYKYGVIRGYPGGEFRPQSNTSREEAVSMITNFLKAVDEVKQPEPTTPPVTPPVTTPVTPPVTPPVTTPVAVTNVNISSNNADPAEAAAGDTVTLTFTTVEQVSKLSNFKINGGNPATFTSVQTGAIWTNTATYVLDGTDPLGVMSFQINVKNSAGIYSQTIEATSDGSSVTIVAPVLAYVPLSDIRIESNNADSTEATVGDTVTLTFTTVEQVSKLSNFKINGGNPATFTSIQTGAIWTNTATYVLDGTDPLGVMSFQINVKNSAGIYSQTIEATSDGSTVTIVAPVLAYVPLSDIRIESNNADSTEATVGDTVTLTFTTVEQVSKLSNFKINGGNPATFTSIQTGAIWTNTATYVLDGTDPSGPTNFQINVKNSAGIYSQTVEATSDGSSVSVIYT